MNVDKTIADIELLEHIFTLPDYRPNLVQDLKPENPMDNEPYVNVLYLWFRPWSPDGR
jgi:hypothetical protein